MTHSYIDNAIFQPSKVKQVNFEHDILDFQIPLGGTLEINSEEEQMIREALGSEELVSNAPEAPPEGEFNINDIEQPADNIRILKPPPGKLTGQQKRAWTKATQEYRNIVNWEPMSQEQIDENMRIGRKHLE